MPMLKLYSPKAAERLLRRYAAWIGQTAARLGMPAACIRAILYRELTQIDLFDPLADLLVRFYWLRWRLRGGRAPLLRLGLLGKRDSSTGYGQIFACVAIRALRFGLERGLLTLPDPALPFDRPPDEGDDADLRRMWLLLYRDAKANILLSALNLLAAAEEMTGRRDLAALSAEELKLAFTRYNADTRRITPYGEAVYGHYLRYREAETKA